MYLSMSYDDDIQYRWEKVNRCSCRPGFTILRLSSWVTSLVMISWSCSINRLISLRHDEFDHFYCIAIAWNDRGTDLLLLTTISAQVQQEFEIVMVLNSWSSSQFSCKDKRGARQERSTILLTFVLVICSPEIVQAIIACCSCTRSIT